MVVELWGLHSKPLHKTGPALSSLLKAVSSQGLNTFEDGDFTTSSGPRFHVWTFSLGGEIWVAPFLQLVSTVSHLIAMFCWEESGSAFSIPSIRQLKPADGSSWEWVSLWVSSLETLSAPPVSPGGTRESIRDCERTIWAVPKTLLLHHPNYSSQTRWEKQVTAGSLLTSGAWTSTDDKLKDSHCCCLIISFR